ncbi:hypothetical protein ES702_05568 [subsurface metagenome]
MLLAARKELEELLRLAGRSEKQIKNERLTELEEEAALDGKETKLYLDETWTEELISTMTWKEKLAWLITGLTTDLSDVDLQVRLNSLKGTTAENELKQLREKKVAMEKRKFKKEEETVKAQIESGILPPGSLESLKEMREKAQEYGFKESSLQTDTKFSKLTTKQLSQKKEYLTYRAKERSEELSELQNVTQIRQQENAKKVLERIGPREYPT